MLIKKDFINNGPTVIAISLNQLPDLTKYMFYCIRYMNRYQY